MLDRNDLRHILERVADWLVLRRVNKEWTPVPDAAHLIIVEDILSMAPDSWPVPVLKGISQVPILHQDGTIHTKRGYDKISQMYYIPKPDFYLAPVPEKPTQSDVKAALETINDIMQDFPFIDECAKTNTIAAFLTAVLRTFIDAPCPAFCLDKPQAGSGATLLQSMIGLVATGEATPGTELPFNDDELQKKILASLIQGQQIIMFDNVTRVFSSSILALILTTRTYSGRILGKNEQVTVKNNAFWMANGNNLSVGGDLARRLWLARIDPKNAMPWQLI